MTATVRRRAWFAWADVEAEAVRQLGGPGARAVSVSRDGWTDIDLANKFGITVENLRQRRARRTMTARTADKYAVAAGYHPAPIWPHWWEAS